MAGIKMTRPGEKQIATIVLAMLLAVSAWPAVAVAQRPANPTGTFSSMYYNRESTDLVGMEIRIVVGRDGYQGTIQYARGEPTDLILFKPMIDDSNHIDFSFTSPWTGERVTISGQITESGLEMGEQPGENLLKRAPSYWDERRSSPP